MKTRVLVVDDSPLIRAVLREAFERTDDLAVVGEAGDGEEAVAKVQELGPDIVTMDVLMPRKDGLAATTEIMRVRPTPILVVARDGEDARGLAVAALGHGALGVFLKPARGFDQQGARELAGTIRRIVREGRPVVSRTVLASEPADKIRVLVVDDSPLVREVLRTSLVQTGDIVVAGEASDGVTALRLARELRPDVVTLDLLMPMMDGDETAQQILLTCSPGILLVTQDQQGAARLLKGQSGGGAFDMFVKPATGLDAEEVAALAQAIRRLAHAAAARRGSTQIKDGPGLSAEAGRISVVGIAGSTGGPRVLRDLLAGLPSDFPVPIVLVQHTERGFTETLIAWLASASRLSVRSARSGYQLAPGDVVVAPDDMHMEIHTGGLVHLRAGEPVDGFRPSATVLLESLARSFGAHAAGVVLSGMGSDGADGLGAIYAAGGVAVVEDPETAVVPGMPRRARLRATGALVERGPQLAGLLSELAAGRSRGSV